MKFSNLAKTMFSVMLVMLLASLSFVKAHEHHMNMMQKPSPAFEKIKQLVGTWNGSSEMMGGKMTDFTVSYELTAGGTAVLEREFVGTPHEMVTLYYPEGNHVALTHYCMLGNRPHMILTKISGNTLSFEMKGNSGIASSKEPHMHHLNLTFVDADHLKAEWTQNVNGKKGQVTIMELTRKS